MTRVANFGLVAMLLSAHAAFPQNSTSAVAGSEQGKAIFVSRCAKCHNADASRKLPDGTTLLGRLAQKQDRKAALATRLKNEQELEAVFSYIQPLIEHWLRSEGQQTSVSPNPSPER
jgi:mono/diheme cytochrome c family protein